MNLNVVLFEPEIPANTGNIARTCAATQVKLHLIRPLGFSTDDKSLRRAGLDYWQYVDVIYHNSLDGFLAKFNDKKLYFITKFGEYLYSEMEVAAGEDVFFIFGKETMGLPKSLISENIGHTLRLPMSCDHVRSLNLSNAVAIVVYEALSKVDFLKLT